MSDWLILTYQDGRMLPVRASAIVACPPIASDLTKGCEIYIHGHDTPFLVRETLDEIRALLR